MSLDLQQTSRWIADVNVTIVLGTAVFVIGFCSFVLHTAMKRFLTENRRVLYISA
jgi:hypothetical protein